MATTYGVAIVCVSHLNKGGGPAMYRTMGSLAFVAAARAAWAVTKDKDDLTGTRRLVLPVKNNLGPDNTGLAYALVDGVVQWEADPVTVTADEALSLPASSTPGPEPETLEKAKEWLRALLAPNPLPATEVRKHARDCAISDATLKRAKQALGVDSYRPVIPGQWYWRLPGATCSTSPQASIPFKPEHLEHVAVNTGENQHAQGQGAQDVGNEHVDPVGGREEGVITASGEDVEVTL